MIVLGIIVLLLFIISVLKVGIIAEYLKNELSVKLLAGPFKIGIVVPAEEKKKQPPRKKKRIKTAKEAAKEAAKEIEKVDIWKIKQLLPGILEMLSRVGKGMVIDQLTMHYLAAGDDPCDTALTFGKTTAGLNSILAALSNFLKIKHSDIQTAIDFESEKSTVYVRAVVTLRVWQTVYIGGRFLLYFIKKRSKEKSAGKKTEYGKVEQ